MLRVSLRERPDADSVFWVVAFLTFLIPFKNHLVELEIVHYGEFEELVLHQSHISCCEMDVELRIRQKMWNGDGGAEISYLAVDNLSQCCIYSEDTQLLQVDYVFQ